MASNRSDHDAASADADRHARSETEEPDSGPFEGDLVEVQGESERFDEDAVLEEILDVVEDDPPVEGSDLATAISQRDEYLEALQRVKAEFDNFRKRTEKERRQTVERAAESLVFKLLPVLDACQAALAQGASDVEPIAKVLAEILQKEGLEPTGAAGEEFDPSVHEAVMQEPAEDDAERDHVAEVLRTGYKWKGSVLRTAMVKVWG